MPFPPQGTRGQAASTTYSGTVELATDTESVTGTLDTVVCTPGNLTARLAAPGAIGGTTPAAGAFTTLSASGLISANGGVTLGAADHLVLPLHDDAATPTLGFGDGDSGFYERVEDYLAIATGGFHRWDITGNIYAASSGRAGLIGGSDASATNPTFLPSHSDADTGIGHAAADQLSLIAGGIEGLRITEANGVANMNIVCYEGTIVCNDNEVVTY